MAEASTRKLMDDLRTVVADAEALMHATAGDAGAEVREARDRAAESLERARRRLESLEAEVKARAREAAEDVDRHVRDNPWQSVGVAAAVGFVIGLLVSRR
jgi:ElaB/YqjD/DUF883 family membrane-anchored ribosome-binding protein